MTPIEGTRVFTVSALRRLKQDCMWLGFAGGWLIGLMMGGLIGAFVQFLKMKGVI